MLLSFMPSRFDLACRAAALCVLAAAAACTGNVVDEPANAGSGGGGGEDPSSTTTATTTTSTGAGGAPASCDNGVRDGAEAGVDCGGNCAPCAVPPTDCQAACAAPLEGSCMDVATCEQTCEEMSPGWSPDVALAFQSCIEGNPLCFETVDACIWSTLYPDPVVQSATLEGTGFDAYEGRTVHASFEKPGGELVAGAPQPIVGGSFTFSWSIEMAIDGAGLVMFYVDADESGTCTAEGDLPGSIFSERSADFATPSWSAKVTPPDPPAAFVCEYL